MIRVYPGSSNVRAEVRNTPYIFEGIYKYIMRALYGCGALKREPASRLMNFNEAVSSRDRCKGCPESGLLVLAVKQPSTKLLLASFYRGEYDLTLRGMICEGCCEPLAEKLDNLLRRSLISKISQGKVRNFGCVKLDLTQVRC